MIYFIFLMCLNARRRNALLEELLREPADKFVIKVWNDDKGLLSVGI